ncbi:MAG: sel1 repeat family protein, partial [Alistipes sp.]|nr:sel1 repeat family protein [Alistipes sp.]
GNGLGVTKNFTEAFNWYYKAAEGGHKVGQFNLGILYEFGNGVTQNYNEAAKWYRKSAEQGYAHAQCNLGYCYENGYGVSQNDAQAYYWYKKAAEQGFDRAQYNLGQCYRVARGTSKDITEAIRWYLKSAEQGYEDAKTRLSELGITPIKVDASLTSDQLNDKGVEHHNKKEYSAAFQYYLKAVEKGNMYSQYNLGLLFQYGLGVTADTTEAVKWYRKSSNQGYEEAKKKIKELGY